jgi:hypothetical protein
VIAKVVEHHQGGPLWRGDTAGYGSASEADLALAGLVAFYCGPNLALIRSVLEHSGLVREKWERKGDDYLARTISKALGGKTEFYEWRVITTGVTTIDASPTTETTETTEVDDFGTSVVSVSRAQERAQPLLELAPEAYQGIAGRAMRTIDPHTESHPAGLLGSFLAYGATAIGPRVYIERDGQRHGVNEFVLLFGPTSIGRKGSATKQIRKLFRADETNYYQTHSHVMERERGEGSRVESEWDKFLVRGLSSGEALIGAMAKEPDQRRLVVESEFARCLKIMEREGSILSDILKAAWDREPLYVRTKRETLCATDPHVSVLAECTEADIRARLKDAELFNGFANRFLWLAVHRTKSLPMGGGPPPTAAVQSAMHEITARREWIGAMELDNHACLLWDEFGIYNRLNEPSPGLLGAVTDRGAPHVLRIALQYAVWDGVREIQVPHLLAALAVWDYSHRTCAYIFGYSTGNPAADLLIEHLEDVWPGFLKRVEIRDKVFQRNARPGVIPGAVDDVLRLGLARRSKIGGTGGRAAEVLTFVRAMGPEPGRQSILEEARGVAQELGYVTGATEI